MHQYNIRKSLPRLLRSNGKEGFTLVEISIALIIIGLLVGGILMGRDLIHTAEIRKTISEVDKIRTAVNTFKLKYGYIPGDLPFPEQYFDTTRWGVQYLGQHNVNWDVGGDGFVQDSVESAMAFPELAAAGLYPGASMITPTTYVTASYAKCGTNMPKGPLGKGLLSVNVFHMLYDR